MDPKIKEHIIDLLQKNQEIPAEFEEDLFPTTKKEYELKYAGKERKEVILNDTMSVPFQAVKHFGKVTEGEWVNKLIFGDNLQALKHLIKLKNEGKLRNPDGTDGVKLVYIDPPFATKQDFKGNQDQKAYTDKIAGSEFIEFVRKRLIILYELLSENGTIYVHLDYRKLHYLKIILDEIFGETNFRNELIWCYSGPSGVSKDFARKHDTILRYSKSENYFYNQIRIPHKSGVHDTKGTSLGYSGKKVNVEDLNSKGKALEDWWTDIYTADRLRSELVNYPTQKSEILIERIITASSNEGDIVLDCFAGSGTTGAVAEKLDRRWIMVDCGKLAIYTIQKRLMNLKEEIGNKGKGLKPKPFTLYNAGLYQDGKLLEQMQEDEYKDFVLELFQCQKSDHKINGLQFHGTLNNHSVLIFDKKDYLTHEFIDSLHKTVGSSVKDAVYIIAPVGVVGFNEDYVKKGQVKYTILRIPNSIIDYIREKNFTRLQQPRSSNDVNQTIDAVGFDFIYPPQVKAEYYSEKPKGKLIDNESVIEIKEFESIQLGAKIVEFKDSKKEALAMVMIDLDYNGDTFNLDKYYFGDEIAKNDFKIKFDDKIGDKLMIIYLDIFGNERKEVISKKDLK
jgi:DNA modification methylase